MLDFDKIGFVKSGENKYVSVNKNNGFKGHYTIHIYNGNIHCSDYNQKPIFRIKDTISKECLLVLLNEFNIIN